MPIRDEGVTIREKEGNRPQDHYEKAGALCYTPKLQRKQTGEGPTYRVFIGRKIAASTGPEGGREESEGPTEGRWSRPIECPKDWNETSAVGRAKKT